jgi:predicted phage terminase large subunit-like protein
MDKLIVLADKIKSYGLSDPKVLKDYFDLLCSMEDKSEAHRRNREIREVSLREGRAKRSGAMLDIYWKSLLFDAPIDFDAYCIYIEKNRPVDKRFYLPRRKRLIDVVSALQELEDDKLDLLGISLPPGAGKTTTALFFLTWLGGKHPEKPILSGSHSNAFLRGAYDECLRIMDPDGDYLFKDVFPDVKVIKTNAQDMMIDMGTDKKQGKRFATLEFSSVGSGNAGKVRAEQLLYCDDLVDGIEAAMSKERMDKLWQLYTTDLRQRKIGNCKELHIATRWSLHDVIGRLASTYEEDERSKFIVLPALDENDESNFDYGNSAGFTTKFYHQQREIMDDASWRALYMGQPIEREGQLYNEDELRRYFELPDGDPDAILSVCDTKDRGTDFCVMPIAYQYGNDFYIESIVCDNGNPETVENRLVSEMLHHNVHMSRFESNSAGGKVAEKIQKEIKAKNGRTKITTKFTTSNKETKIIVNSPFVKERFLFKDDSVLKNNKEYRKALGMLCGYTMAGKNKHDDVPDAFAMLAEFVQSLEKGRVEVFKRPF